MARTKTTARKCNVDNGLHVKRHRCRFPGCDRMFAFRQGMSRHMILGGMPTFNTLAPGIATDANPLSAPHVEGMDETASYAAPDEPECDEALPAPPPRLRAPRSLARQTVHLRTRGRARRVSLPRAASIGPPSLPEDRLGGKDIRREFEQMLETSLWPHQPVRLPHSDLVKVMRAFPDASSVELAISTAHHVDVSRQQANILSRRFAAMVAVEQNVLHHIRRLLPVNATASSSLEAVHNIDAYCTSVTKSATLRFRLSETFCIEHRSLDLLPSDAIVINLAVVPVSGTAR